MQGRTRRGAAIGAAAFVLAGSAVLATPGTADAADVITANCGDTVTAHPGDQIKSPLGLQTVTDGLTLLTGLLCKITVNVVDTVVAPIPQVGPPLAGAVEGAVGGTTGTLNGAVDSAGQALGGGKQSQPAPQNPPSGGQPQSGPSGGPNPGLASFIPEPSSPVLGGGGPGMFTMLPFGAGGYAPMRDYSDIPYALAGLFAPSPGIRYGGQVPGYAPEVGALGNNTQQSKPLQNAGQAEALPGQRGAGIPGNAGLPMLIAVLALSGVSAALVRTWVLRSAPSA